MLETTVTHVSSSVTISELRTEVANAVVRAYGAERSYAHALCDFLPTEWYLTEHSDKGADAKAVHAEKKELFAVLKKAEHTNPSTVWARVRKYAQEYIEGTPEKTEGSTDASVGARQNRSLTLRLVEELTTLYKATKNADSLSDKERDCQTHIASALTAMGIDLATIQE
jgi:hypothetical protein